MLYNDITMVNENDQNEEAYHEPWFASEMKFEPMFPNSDLFKKQSDNYLYTQHKSNENALKSTREELTCTYENNCDKSECQNYIEGEDSFPHNEDQNYYNQLHNNDYQLLDESPVEHFTGTEAEVEIENEICSDEESKTTKRKLSFLDLSSEQKNIMIKKEGFYKKLSTHRMKYMIRKINKNLKFLIKTLKLAKNEQFNDKDLEKILKVDKLPNKEFTSKILTPLIKKALKMNLWQIYSYAWVTDYEYNSEKNKHYPKKFTKSDIMNYENHLKVIEVLQKFKSEPSLEFMNQTLESITTEYFKSKQFEKDKEEIIDNICEEKCENEMNECTGFCKLYEDKLMGHATGSKYELGYLKDFLFSQGNNPREEQKSKQNVKKKIKTFKIVKSSEHDVLTTKYEESESYCIDFSGLEI